MTSSFSVSSFRIIEGSYSHPAFSRVHVLRVLPVVKYDKEMDICLLENDPKMSKYHANVVSFDENVSYLSTSMNLYERIEQYFYERNSF